MTNVLTGKDLLLATLRHEPTPAVPWVPFAGVHAGKLKGYTAREVLTDGDKLFESLLAVNQTYDPDGQPIVFDLQIEAEILGCDLVWVEKGPPTVASHPLEAVMTVPTRLPEAADGRLPLILDVMRRMKAAVGDRTALYGLITGPFTLASHLRGTEIFMDMFDHPDFLHDLLAFGREVAQRMAALYIAAGMDVIAVVDPLVSQVSPRHFRQFLSAPCRDLFASIREQGAYSSFFVCGDATKNIEEMCHTGPDSISVDENIDLVAAKRITDAHNLAIGGNIPLTTRMLLGSQQDNMKFVTDLLAQIEPHNFILAPGCDMPYDVPIENVVGVLQAVRDPTATRAMLTHYQAAELDLDAVILPDYATLERPLVEVFTLDSDTCSACGYMRDAARRATAELAGQVDMVEYKFTQKENVARVVKMGVKNLPSIYINGELAYSSIIPSNRELVEKIRQIKNQGVKNHES
ncbi:MAG TPA: uroporphyrinogen decarboxylase family protein [Anaerolineae bacterium]|nr:uroporphyrinogen decarboxylase family protein [Anaerolineae bacterium]HQH38680.1 uroporphyrinogen decarboxylase family protein [Anaerolineae bacterium]